MLSAPAPDDRKLQTLLDPRRVMRWVYVGRLTLASAIFLAAVFVWQRALSSDTLVASLAFAGAVLVTAASAAYAEVHRRPLGRGFYYGQSLADLLLVTAVVHVTGGGGSQFAALYTIVIATAALLLPTAGGTMLVALVGCAFYFGDVIVVRDAPPDIALVLQLAVFGAVALGCGLVAARLRAVGAGSAELAAELAKFRLQAADILTTIRSGIVTVDEGGVLLYANPSAESLLGLPLASRVGQPILGDLVRVAPNLARALERTAKDGERISRGEAAISANGRTYPIGLATTRSTGPMQAVAPDDPPPAGPRPAVATVIFQDISDHKRLESLHLRAERLEAVAELSASLAHEIKNPLAAVRSAVEQLARMPAFAGVGGADDGEESDAATLSRLIVRETDRLSRLLSEFLDFARVRVTRVSAVDICAIARDAVSLAAAHPDRGEGVTVACSTPDEPLVIAGDHDLLHRAVFNLALNAVQAAPAAGGRVTVEVSPLPREQTPSGLSFEDGAVALRVTDNGGGIPASIRDSLFEPFTTTKPGGSGLGLPVVHRAIEAHKGVVFVDSSDEGTRFTVLLPRGAGGG